MKSSVPLIFLCAGLLAGCASQSPQEFSKPAGPSPSPKQSQTVVTPDVTLAARVVSYNSVGQFAVLSFPVGQMPQTGQTFSIYRAGLKVGEVKITGPQRDSNIVADLVSGNAQVGDEVRQQ